VPRQWTAGAREGARWEEPELQPEPEVPVLKRVELEELPPVFGTAVPPRGLSGLLRRRAYAIPEYATRHTLLLLVADRVDVVESRLRGVRALGLALGVLGGGWLLKRLRF
jgi:hypothetical protein